MKVVDDARAARLVSKVRALLAGKSDAGHTHTPSQVGAAPASHTHDYAASGHTHSLASLGAAAASHTHAAMGAASPSSAGSAGLVPAPAAGAADRYLRSDGAWAVPPDTNTTYAAATQSAQGLMSAADKKKLDGIASGATANSLTWQKIYPVGAVYISYVSTSPASLFGGTWTQITGRFLRMANDVSTGGADNVTLTAAQMPSHTHGVQGYFNRVAYNSYSNSEFEVSYNRIASDGASGNTPVLSAGSGNSHSNMPAYQDLYAWRRTA